MLKENKPVIKQIDIMRSAEATKVAREKDLNALISFDNILSYEGCEADKQCYITIRHTRDTLEDIVCSRQVARLFLSYIKTDLEKKVKEAEDEYVKEKTKLKEML